MRGSSTSAWPRPAGSPTRMTRPARSFAVFEAERAALIPYRGPFEGSRLQIGTVSKTCLVRFDHNRYSVMARAVGRPVEIAAYAERIVIRQDGAIVGEHARRVGRGQTSYDPWHYVPVLSRKPGALRNGAPFKGWVLPGAVGRVQRKLTRLEDGDRQVVTILSTVLSDGLEGRRHGLSGGARRWRRQCRRDPQHPGAATRTGPSPPTC